MAIDTFRFTTHNADEAFSLLNSTFARDGAPIHFNSVDEADFTFEIDMYSSGEVSAHRAKCQAEARSSCDQHPYFMAGVFLDGIFEIEQRARIHTARAGDVQCSPTDGHYAARWARPAGAYINVHAEAMARMAAEMYGESCGRVVMTDSRPTSDQAAEQWRNLTRFVVAMLRPSNDWGDRKLVDRRLADLAAATALHVFPHRVTGSAQSMTALPVRSASLRRAVSFIESHIADPITVGDIAAAARVTPRSLQMSFRRHYGVPPSSYIRSVRLELAHDDLKRADPTQGDTVRAVAARWGFANAGRFARYHRDKYGISPEEMLRL